VQKPVLSAGGVPLDQRAGRAARAAVVLEAAAAPASAPRCVCRRAVFGGGAIAAVADSVRGQPAARPDASLMQRHMRLHAPGAAIWQAVWGLPPTQSAWGVEGSLTSLGAYSPDRDGGCPG